MNGKKGIEYLETIHYISNEYILKTLIIIYVQNKNIKINKNVSIEPVKTIILTYNEKDILNYYNDHFDRLKEKNIKYIERNEALDEAYGTSYKFPKIAETKIIKEEDNGWGVKKNIDINIFNSINVEKALGIYRSNIFTRNMYKVYKENNCLDLYIKYYGNYFGADYIVEVSSTIITACKMFLYVYTSEENDGKSFYSIINNTLRSGDSEKICRYLPEFKLIYDLI